MTTRLEGLRCAIVALVTLPSTCPAVQVSAQAPSAETRCCSEPATAQLMAAVERFDILETRQLLRSGADPNRRFRRFEGEEDLGRTPLQVAVASGREPLVRLLLEARADTNAFAFLENTGETRSVLSLAAAGGWIPVITVLLAFGARAQAVDADGTTPAHHAAAEGHVEALRTLKVAGVQFERADSTGQTPLLRAARNGHRPVVEYLLNQKNIDLNWRDHYGHSAITSAIFHNHDDVARVLMPRVDLNTRTRRGETPLHFAVSGGHIDQCRQLVALGANPKATDYDGHTLLMSAAAEGTGTLCQYMLDLGLEVDAKSRRGYTALMNSNSAACTRLLLQRGARVNETNVHGESALTLAVQSRQQELVEVLLQHHADPNIVPERLTVPLAYAAMVDDAGVVEVLLRGGADPNLRDRDCKTPLMLAAMGGSEASAQLLLQHGADPNLRDERGKTAIEIASESDYADMERLISTWVRAVARPSASHSSRRSRENPQNCKTRAPKPSRETVGRQL